MIDCRLSQIKSLISIAPVSPNYNCIQTSPPQLHHSTYYQIVGRTRYSCLVCRYLDRHNTNQVPCFYSENYAILAIDFCIVRGNLN